MFRRSNSSSHIPMRKVNLFGTRDTRSTQGAASRRSQSATRLSQRDSETQILRQPRKSSLDRKSNTLGVPRTTPITRAGNRAGSLQRTTPNSAISQRKTSSRGTTPISCRQERKVTIQKLATDKKWVMEQYSKVQNFIAENPDIFDHSVVNTTNIKPPSINIFIYVTEMLLIEIFPKIKLRTENYKEAIPTHLKMLRYPGTLTASILKTVNTMHSWPQVIGMWSWLIDKVNLGRSSEDASFIDSMDPEERQKHLLNQNCWDFLTKRYTIFNTDDENSAEEVQKTKDQYIKNLAEILQVDFEKCRQLQQDVSAKKKYRDKQMAENERLKAEMSRMQSEIDEMKKEMADFEEGAVVEQKDLDEELRLLQINVKELGDARIATEENINQLREAIKVQPCTYQEKLSLVRQIDELRSEIQVKKEKIEHAQKIKNKFDHQLTSDISKIQTIAIQWNRSLMEVCIQKPELKKLLLREKGFHDPQFLNEINEVRIHKVAIEDEIKKKLVEVEDDLKIQEQKKQETERDIKELTKEVEHTNQECARIEEIISKIKTEMKEIETDLEQKKKYHLEYLKKIQEDANLEDQEKAIATLKEEKENLEVEVKKFAQKTLCFFLEMHNQVINNIKEMDAIRMNVEKDVEGRIAATLERNRQLKEILSSIKNGNEKSSS